MQTKVHRGQLNGEGKRFAVVAARWNDLFTEKLLSGALEAFSGARVAEGDVEVFRVPGSFELPLACLKAAETRRFDAVVALGVIIRGETSHFDHVAGEAARGIAHVSLSTGVPVIFGVVTAENLEQAIDRCGAKAGNKGFEAALAAVEMADLDAQIADAMEQGKDKVFPHVV